MKECGFLAWVPLVDARPARSAGRGLGAWMFVASTSPWWAGMDKNTLCKLYLILDIYFTPLFAYCAFYLDTTGPGPNAIVPINLWIPQIGISVIYVVLTYLAIKDLPKSAGAMF